MKMMSCKEVHELVASDALAEASFWRRLGLRLHLLMCQHCRTYVAQIRSIGAAAHELLREGLWDRDALDRLEADILLQAGELPAPSSDDGGPLGDPRESR
jgi:hypothetical protein